MTITTSTYEGSHGRKPKLSEYGLWFFAITRRSGETTTFQTTATYRDAAKAAKAAKAEAKLIGGASQITVMP